MKKFLALCLLMLPAAARADEYLTADKFLKLYDGGSESGRELAKLTITNIESGFGWMNAYLVNRRKEPAAYCSPKKLSLTGEQLVEILRDQLRERNALGDLPVGLVLLTSLERVFPCGDPAK